ncbi:apospory-associated protein, putative [Trichomonas vaginalis G3]|uniref:Apospory-associated protein, putative n=1 Tax=Trichomonas vaginalis (strain ATCC PRA-98 / G3) TaxID=412133 RepID=A2DAB9_TRIV3|nr:sterile alpha motif-containing protein [Trichomonas vaginalis G3]EAY22767.1 apospory-associated protein, putative [Trichomonas vaginalis G3]KAI5525578.1 sterile alpha motif-containing protein [Trichomonas vaginalis G3]|eukprot:XP_001583753.1 apospory-associated protein [Trichomonas vaginalis G3]
MSELLILHGANVNIKDENHNTPLHYAIAYSKEETMKLLLSHGALDNPNDGSVIGFGCHIA